MPTMSLHDCIARAEELEDEVKCLSDTLIFSTSISGAALSNPLLHFITDVKPECMKKLWRLPSNLPDIEKALSDLSDHISEYPEEGNDILNEGITPWKAHFRSCDTYYALKKAFERAVFHHPDRNSDDPLPYTFLKYVFTICTD